MSNEDEDENEHLTADENKHLRTRGFPAKLLGDPATWKKTLPDPEWPLPEGWKFYPDMGQYVYLGSRAISQQMLDKYMDKYCQNLPTILEFYFAPIGAECAKSDESMAVRN